MSMDLGAKGGVKSDINVTPLVDVMLVLLIIMMIIAPMLQKGVDVKLPTAVNSAGQARHAGADRRCGHRRQADSISTRSQCPTADMLRRLQRGARGQEGKDRLHQGGPGRAVRRA